jgi:hypothetical protein
MRIKRYDEAGPVSQRVRDVLAFVLGLLLIIVTFALSPLMWLGDKLAAAYDRRKR